MQSRTLVCALAAASLTFSSLSFAQPNDSRTRSDPYAQGRGDNEYRGDQRRDERGNKHSNKHNNKHNDNRSDNNNRDDGRDNHRGDRHADGRGGQNYYYGARGPDWRRGGHVPAQYRGHQYVVNDWRGHHLNAPPRGHQWVQVGGDYVLVAIATGVIISLLLAQ